MLSDDLDRLAEHVTEVLGHSAIGRAIARTLRARAEDARRLESRLGALPAAEISQGNIISLEQARRGRELAALTEGGRDGATN